MLTVALGLAVAALAVGELCFSLPGSRIPINEADDLVSEALKDLALRQQEEKLEAHVKAFQLEQGLKGEVLYSPAAYLSSRPSPIRIHADLRRAAGALARGETPEFREFESHVYLYMVNR